MVPRRNGTLPVGRAPFWGSVSTLGVMMSRFALLGAGFLAPVVLLASASLGNADEDPMKAAATTTFSMKPGTDTPFEITTVNTRFETDQMLPTVGPDAGKEGVDIYQLVEIEETHVNK